MSTYCKIIGIILSKLMANEDREREEKKMAKALVASQRRMARYLDMIVNLIQSTYTF